MSQQITLVPNNIVRFAKMNHTHFMANALERKDVVDFCRHFFCLTMDRNGLAEFSDAVTVVIAGLTNWQIGTIRKALSRMVTDGEIVRPNANDKAVILNDALINRQGLAKPFKTQYELQGGKDPQYTAKQHEMISKLNEFVKLNEERMMSITAENERLLAENMQLKLELAELKGQMRGFTQGMDKAIEKTLGQCLETIKGQGTPAPERIENPPVLSLIKTGGDMRLDRGSNK